MEKHLERKHDEVQVKKYDEELLQLLKQGHRALITQIIKDYLLSYE